MSASGQDGTMTEEQPGHAERNDEPTTEQTGGGVDPDESATSDQNPPDEGGADAAEPA